MSASNNPSEPLFHGSIHPFQKGDIIMPGRTGLSWASSNLRHATEYARMGNRRALSNDSDYKVEDQPVLFGTVYNVEPLKNDLVSKGKIYASPSGFRVTGIEKFTEMRNAKEALQSRLLRPLLRQLLRPLLRQDISSPTQSATSGTIKKKVFNNIIE
jgi:hypothetical protein